MSGERTRFFFHLSRRTFLYERIFSLFYARGENYFTYQLNVSIKPMSDVGLSKGERKRDDLLMWSSQINRILFS